MQRRQGRKPAAPCLLGVPPMREVQMRQPLEKRWLEQRCTVGALQMMEQHMSQHSCQRQSTAASVQCINQQHTKECWRLLPGCVASFVGNPHSLHTGTDSSSTQPTTARHKQGRLGREQHDCSCLCFGHKQQHMCMYACMHLFMGFLQPAASYQKQ